MTADSKSDAKLVYRSDQPIYERQPGEGRSAWRAFCQYRDQGPERTLWAVVKPLREIYKFAASAEPNKKFPGPKKIAAMVQKWWTLFRWWDRVAAWDRAQTLAKERDKRKSLEEMNARHVDLAKQLQIKAVQRLLLLPTSELTTKDVLAYIEKGQRLEAAAIGKPEAAKQVQITGQNGGPVATVNAHVHAMAPQRVIETLVTSREEVKQLLALGMMEGENVIGG